MCDEIVTLWRLAALNPALSPIQRDDLATQLKDWHIKTIDRVRKGRSANLSATNTNVKRADIEIFSGFKSGIEACQLDWKDYPIQGLTYLENDFHIRWKFSLGRGLDGDNRKFGRGKSQVIAQASTTGAQHKIGGAVANVIMPNQHSLQRHMHRFPSRQVVPDADSNLPNNDGGCSSSSEGFCENDRMDSLPNPHDSDSDFNEAIDSHQKHKQSHQMSLGFGEAPAKQKEMRGISNMNMHAHHSRGASYGENAPNVTSRGTEDVDSDSSNAGAGAAAPSASAPNPVKSADLGAEVAVNNYSGLHTDESHPSSDEYQVYFFDPKLKFPDPPIDKKKKSDEPNYFAGIKKIENKQDVSFFIDCYH